MMKPQSRFPMPADSHTLNQPSYTGGNAQSLEGTSESQEKPVKSPKTSARLGIAIWCLYAQRKRFASVFKSLWKGGEERGLSLRTIPTLLLIGAFGWYALMLVEGADPLIALARAKTKIPFFWFINVPALYVSMTIANYMWLTSLIALVIKFLVIRTIGIKKYEEYAMPIVAGWILGFGALWLPAALINMGTVVFPKMQTMFQP